MKELKIIVFLLFTMSFGCKSIDDRTKFFISSISPIATPDASINKFNCSPSTASYGSVKGTLYLTDHRPAVGSILYLGDYVGLETNAPLVIVDPSRHPYTRTGDGGQFCFRDVPPGRYGLVVWNAVESVLVTDPATGYSLLVEVKAGIITNVGNIFSPIP